MAKPGATGIKRIIDATGYSAKGLRAALRHESAFRQELSLALLLIPAALWLGQTATERAVLIGCLFLVLMVELLNSGLEAVVDRIGDEYHKLAGRAKDMGSAAVFLSMLNVVVIWLLFLFERFISL